MFLVDFLFALVIGFLLTVLFSLLFDSRGPWDTMWVFLLLVVLGTWVGGLWIVPFGPVLFEVSWIPFVLAGLMFALLLSAAAPPTTLADQPNVPTTAPQTELAFSIFFWLLLVGLVVAVVLAYI